MRSLSTRSMVLALATSALLCTASCSCGSAPAPLDARVPVDARVVRVDARFDVREFPPRRVFFDPDVTCTEQRYDRTLPDREPAEPGSIRFTVDPRTDPRYRDALYRETSSRFQIQRTPMTLLPTGGFMAITPEFLEMGIGPDGMWQSMRFYVNDGLVFLLPHMILPDETTVFGHGRDFGIRRPLEPPEYRWLPPPELGWTAVNGSPTLMHDGTIAYWTSNSAIMAACPDTGRIRWVVEVSPGGGWGPDVPVVGPNRSLFADATGLVAVVHPYFAYRLDMDGLFVAEAQLSRDEEVRPTPVFAVLGMSDACGLGVLLNNPERLQWLDPTTLERRQTIDGWPLVATPDCGAMIDTLETVQRVAPDGAIEWALEPPPEPFYPRGEWLIPLADGGLFVGYDWTVAPDFDPASPVLHVRVLNADGSQRWQRTYSFGEVGTDRFMDGSLLTPDGVLYFGMGDGLVPPQRFCAIEIGVGPAVPFLWPGSASDWWRTSSTWASASAE